MPLTRRELLVRTGAGLGAATVASAVAPAASAAAPAEPFGYCLNTATLRGHKLSLVEEVDIAAQAGYQAIEPWVSEVRSYAEAGKSLPDLRKRIADRGLRVESSIGFSDWLSDDDARRAAGLELFKQDMELVARIGAKRIAAPPKAAYSTPMTDLLRIADRYRTLLELGKQQGVVPELELWGSSKTLSRLGEIAFVIVEAAHADACALLDVFHIYKGASHFASLRMFNGSTLHVLHVNDYPADPPREKVTDADRVYPGDGVAPYGELLRNLRDIGYRGFLSLELFNRGYWQQDALTVARTGREKIQAVVQKALG